MEKEDFLALMSFPIEWLKYDMYPDELFFEQLKGYKLGHEESSEHDRNGAFHWWLKKKTSRERLVILVEPAFVDPDPFLTHDVIKYIKKSDNFDEEIERLIQKYN